MRTSSDRILTTHVGSLPRSQAVTDVLFGREKGELPDRPAAAKVITDAVSAVVRRQVETGVDIVSDGETNKISYATYIADRFAGFGGDTPREPGQDLVEFTLDHPAVEKINSARRKDAHSELKRWLAGDHHSNNTYR